MFQEENHVKHQFRTLNALSCVNIEMCFELQMETLNTAHGMRKTLKLGNKNEKLNWFQVFHDHYACNSNCKQIKAMSCHSLINKRVGIVIVEDEQNTLFIGKYKKKKLWTGDSFLITTQSIVLYSVFDVQVVEATLAWADRLSPSCIRPSL